MSIIITVILIGLFLASVLLDQAYRALPAKELKRRARGGHDESALGIYKMVSYGHSLEILLWLTGSIAVGLLAVMAAGISSWMGVGVILVSSWIYIASRQYHSVGGKLWRLAAGLAPSAAWVLSHAQPVLGRLAVRTRNHDSRHNIFEKEDLVELLQKQVGNPHSRLSQEDLNLAAGALTFADKKVSDVMQASSEIRFVGQDEAIGPLLMDELHKTGSKYFPVAENLKSKQPEIIGVLYLKDIIMNENNQKVSDVMQKEVNYINEACSLHQALGAFVKAQTHMFVVTNSFEEKIGVITMDKLLERITGKLNQEDDFDRYDNLLAVAGMEMNAEAPKQSEPAQG